MLTDTEKALERVCSVEIKDYKKIEDGFFLRGPMAQQFAEHMPYLVFATPGYVADIMKDGLVISTIGETYIKVPGLESSRKVRLSFEGRYLDCEIIRCTTEGFYVKEKIDASSCLVVGYGVDDFMKIDFNGLTSENTAAIQQLNKDNKEMKGIILNLIKRLEVIENG